MRAPVRRTAMTGLLRKVPRVTNCRNGPNIVSAAMAARTRLAPADTAQLISINNHHQQCFHNLHQNLPTNEVGERCRPGAEDNPGQDKPRPGEPRHKDAIIEKKVTTAGEGGEDGEGEEGGEGEEAGGQRPQRDGAGGGS